MATGEHTEPHGKTQIMSRCPWIKLGSGCRYADGTGVWQWMALEWRHGRKERHTSRRNWKPARQLMALEYDLCVLHCRGERRARRSMHKYLLHVYESPASSGESGTSWRMHRMDGTGVQDKWHLHRYPSRSVTTHSPCLIMCITSQHAIHRSSVAPGFCFAHLYYVHSCACSFLRSIT